MNVFAFAGTKRRALALVGAAALSLSMVVPALAADTASINTNLTVTGGQLTFTAAPTVGNLTDVTLNGTIQHPTATLSDFQVSDLTGTGAGWQVNVLATQFKEYVASAYVQDGHSIPTDSLVMEHLTVAPNGDTTSTAPDITAGDYTIDNTAQSAVVVATAVADTGMGVYDFSATDSVITLTLTVPSNTYATSYRSDVTIDLITTP